ncbi:MAG: hypothetical protein LUQ11_00405 [Methylococcaceae bacterium]|nr:hypothetical protein [Methylococcaceae bacterium]
MKSITNVLLRLETPINQLLSDSVVSSTSEISGLNHHTLLTTSNILKHQFINRLPASFREPLAEKFLRRPAAPGPATEHAIQYLLSIVKAERKQKQPREATVAAGADRFYEHQYRQFLNPTMGAFAMTATQALLGSGGPLLHRGWRSYRRTYAAVSTQIGDIMPILVLTNQTVAIPLLLPAQEPEHLNHPLNTWPLGAQPMPSLYRQLIAGEEVRCHNYGVRAFERSAEGSLLEVIDAARQSRKLAVLALHPHDSDAMGLHITLFDIGFLSPAQLTTEYGLPDDSLKVHFETARRLKRRLVYCVGGTEEVFTQCSQNLFAKQPLSSLHRVRPASPPNAWSPALPLQRLIRDQFEMFQVTVSASGLPGASPRNGARGKAAFVASQHGRPILLIPYHPGNAVHGHAAKLWSNPYATIVVSDDHSALTRVIISGPSQIISHGQVIKHFPAIAHEVAAQTGRNNLPVAEPEYWFLQEVAALIQEREPLPANKLMPERSTCSISARGKALHNKKPAYFDAGSLPAYDPDLHHSRQRSGRLRDPKGQEHRRWQTLVKPSLESRLKHLDDFWHINQKTSTDLSPTLSGYSPDVFSLEKIPLTT